MMPSGMKQDFSTIRQPQKVDSDDGIPLEDSEDDGVPLEEDDGVPIEEDDGVPLEEDDGVPIEEDDGVPIAEDDGAPQVTEEDLESRNRDAQFGALLPTSLMLPDDATPKDLPRKLGSPLTMSDLLPASLILNGIDEFEEEEKLPEVDIEKALEALQARKEFTSKVKSAGGKREALKLEKKRKQISRLNSKHKKEIGETFERSQQRLQAFKAKNDADLEKAKLTLDREYKQFEKNLQRAQKEKDAQLELLTKTNNQKKINLLKCQMKHGLIQKNKLKQNMLKENQK